MYETLRWEGTLDWALGHVVDRGLGSVQPDLLDVLRLGAWQLLRGAVPDRAAVATSVDVARQQVGARTAGFTNGVLRALARRRDQLPWPAADSDEGSALALGWPAWSVAAAREVFGPRTTDVLAASNEPAGLVLRARGGPSARAALIDELRGAGLDAHPGPRSPSAVRLPGGDPGQLVAVAEGRAAVQDAASMVVVEDLAAAVVGRPEQTDLALRGARVADLCAGPGGKTAHLVDLGATVFATDVHLHRARLVRGAVRPGDAHVVVADVTRPVWEHGAFDAVLVDAPCTGLGVTRRRPEIRWTRSAEDPGRLAGLQSTLLARALELLAPGGVLVYSACTWTVPETTGVIRELLALHGDELEPVRGAGRQLDPADDHCDGMYVAVLRRAGRHHF